MISFTDARERLLTLAKSFGTARIDTHDALGRVVARPLYADRDYPPFHRATVDGYAVRQIDFEEGERVFTVIEEVFAGGVANKALSKGDCYKIMTGAAVPLSADVVIRKEDTRPVANQVLMDIPSVRPFQNMARRGEDMQEGALYLHPGTRCTPQVLSALSVIGREEVEVEMLPATAIFSTGNEVVSLGTTPLPNQIRESNTPAITAMLAAYNIAVSGRAHLPDNRSAILQELSSHLEKSLLFITGGASAGEADFIPGVLESLGFEKVFDQVAIRPGRPVWVGQRSNGCMAFALPGNPVSAQATFKLFAEPYLRACFGLPQQPYWVMPLAKDKTKSVKLDEFFPCYWHDAPYGLMPSAFRSSGDITATVYSQGLALHEKDREDIREGELVKFLLW